MGRRRWYRWCVGWAAVPHYCEYTEIVLEYKPGHLISYLQSAAGDLGIVERYGIEAPQITEEL